MPPQTDLMLPSWKYNPDGTAPNTEQQSIADAALALMSNEPSEVPSTSGDFYRCGGWQESFAHT